MNTNQQRAELDQLFARIFTDLSALTLDQAAVGTRRVVELSASFLSGEVTDAVKEFRRLYFGGDGVQQTAEAVNKEVDDLFEELSALRAEGADLDAVKDAVHEDDSAKTQRLSLAGIHRQLESFIAFNHDIKEKLVPVLSVLQFEDLLRQRVGHVRDGIDLIAAAPDVEHTQAGCQLLAEQLAAQLSSQKEREIFYEKVLREQAPEGVDEGFFSFDTDETKSA